MSATSDNEPVLRVDGLSVDFRTSSGPVTAVSGVSFAVREREIVAVVGESGSGKSTTAMAVLQLLAPNAHVSGGIQLLGRDVLALRGEQLRRVRGKDAAMIFQEPMTALNPLHTIGAQLVEAMRNHATPQERRSRDFRAEAVRLLHRVGIPEPERRLRQYPHQLSGGQRQRVVIAVALSCRPRLIIADEPTTALDVTVQAGILDLLRDIRDTDGTAVLLITHNMGVVADIADRVLVMRHGELVEQAGTERLFAAPSHDYTRALLAAVPKLGDRDRATDSGVDGDTKASEVDTGNASSEPDTGAAPAALELTDVVVSYATGRGTGLRALDRVSLRLAPGEMLGLVGESGSGKSTLGQCALGLITPDAGEVRVFGTPLRRARGRAGRALRGQLGVVFQDPASSLDPRMTVAQCVAEPLLVHRVRDRAERARRVAELLDAVELGSAVHHRFPHELSGGQRQRVSLARALVLRPKLLVADEPTSALDVSVQATVLDVLTRLHRELGFACLFISHDLAVVDAVCDRVAVMRAGRIIEDGPRRDILTNAGQEYTRQLVMSSPVPDPVRQRRRRGDRAAGTTTGAAR